jgi:CRISPR system Cascade subunit CasD
LDRCDRAEQAALSQSFQFAARTDAKELVWQEWGEEQRRPLTPVKLTDYHTILDARRANRAPRADETVQSWREYLFDAAYTIALAEMAEAAYPLGCIAEAVQRPVYTPFLGRRSCPLSRPLLHGMVEAQDIIAALNAVQPRRGLIYSEVEMRGAALMQVRDMPMFRKQRQFATRGLYIQPQGDAP